MPNQTAEPTADDGGKFCGGKRKQSPGTCTRPAGWGTDHPGIGKCKLHGGSTTNHQRHAAHEKARRVVAGLNLRREIDPHEALLEEVHRAAGIVAWLDEKVRSLPEGELTWGVTQEVTRQSGETPGVDTTQSAELSVWVKWWQQERAALAKVSKLALDAGVEERQVRLAEAQGAKLAQVIRDILADLDLTPEQQARVPVVVPRRLRAAAELGD